MAIKDKNFFSTLIPQTDKDRILDEVGYKMALFLPPRSLIKMVHASFLHMLVQLEYPGVA